MSDSSILSPEVSLTDEEEDEPEERKKSRGKKGRGDKKDKSPKESRDEEKAPSELNTQTNIDDLAERFKRLELKLGKRDRQSSQPPKVA